MTPEIVSPDIFDTIVIPGVKLLIIFGILVLAVPIMVLTERKVIGLIQQRPGPNRVGFKQLYYRLRGKEIPRGKPAFGVFFGGELQTIVDGIKLLLKEDFIPASANRAVFIIAPILTLVPAFLTFLIIPIGPTIEMFIAGELRIVPLSVTQLPVGILFYLAITSIGVYGIVLAGWASNSKYALLGSIRSSAQLVSYELTLGLSIVGVLLIVGSFDIWTMVESQEGGFWAWHIFRQPLGWMLFLIGGFAETNRLPFDLPEGESELGAGFHTEYSSMKWAMFMMAEYINILTFAAITTTLFLGSFYGPIPIPAIAEIPLLAAVSGIFWFFLKVGLIFFFFVWVRGTLPRLRYDQLMDLGWKIMLPLAIVNVVVSAFIVALGLSVWLTGWILFAASAALIVIVEVQSTKAKRRFLEGGARTHAH